MEGVLLRQGNNGVIVLSEVENVLADSAGTLTARMKELDKDGVRMRASAATLGYLFQTRAQMKDNTGRNTGWFLR